MGVGRIQSRNRNSAQLTEHRQGFKRELVVMHLPRVKNDVLTSLEGGKFSKRCLYPSTNQIIEQIDHRELETYTDSQYSRRKRLGTSQRGNFLPQKEISHSTVLMIC